MELSVYQWQWQTGRLLRAMGDRDGAITAYTQAVRTVQSLRDSLPCAYGTHATDFRTTLGPIYFELADLLLQRAAATSDASHATVDLERARHTVEQFKAAELRDYWGDACIDATQMTEVSLETVSATTAIVYPIALPDRLELLVGLPGGLKRFAVPVPADKVARVSRGFRRFVQQGRPAYTRLARTLYDWLIRPFEAELQALDIRTLVFVPDGALRTVPLAALFDGRQFLIQKYAVAMTPGLQLTDPQPLEHRNLRMLAAGASQPSTPGFAALPYIEQELQALERLLPGRVRRLPELGLDELEAAIRSQPFSLVHIASHARFAPDAENSFLLTSDGGQLTMPRLQAVMSRTRFRDQPLALLTLSACETALGGDRAALGLAGVAVRAGVRSVLATVWRVEDASTATLMQGFYQHLLQAGMPRAQALQHAQLALLADATYRHPYYWAPFLLINSWL